MAFQENLPFDDPSGDLIVRMLTNSGHQVVSSVLVPDDEQEIKKAVEEILESEDAAAVIVYGGTGIAPKDVTIEATTPLFTKRLPGFGELFRALSYETIGSAALMSRAIAGTAKGKVVFCIPGSRHAVQLCLDKLILPETGHILKHTREKR
jgi:molybdenum cofactor biosynthesis protein B